MFSYFRMSPAQSVLHSKASFRIRLSTLPSNLGEPLQKVLLGCLVKYSSFFVNNQVLPSKLQSLSIFVWLMTSIADGGPASTKHQLMTCNPFY